MGMSIQQRFHAWKDFTRKNVYALKPYLLQDGKKHPVAVICPGGGYYAVCSYVEGAPFAKELNKLGYHAIVVYYRVKSQAHFPNPQDDLARAVREIHSRAEEWNLDMENYSVWGSSAGGHLVGSFGTESMGYVKYGLPKPGALVLTYPVVTMGPLTHTGSRDNLIGRNPSEETVAATSIELQITAAYPPTFLWCGDTDHTVDPENSHMLAAALQANGIPHEFREYPGVDHGVGLGAGLACEEWFSCAVNFWENQRSKSI